MDSHVFFNLKSNPKKKPSPNHQVSGKVTAIAVTCVGKRVVVLTISSVKSNAKKKPSPYLLSGKVTATVLLSNGSAIMGEEVVLMIS